MTQKRRLLGWAHAKDYNVLLISLLFIITVWGFIVADRDWISPLLSIGTVIMMASALFACFRSRVAFVTGLVIGLVALICQGVAEVWRIDHLFHAAAVLRVLFFGMVTYGVLKDVVQSRRVTTRVIAGACSVYLLIAITFGTLYSLMENFSPGSFNFPNLPETSYTEGGEYDSKSALLSYYSLVTLTTIGYGDVTPATATARTLSALEGVLGQLFIAVVLARLVGIEISTRMKDGKDDS